MGARAAATAAGDRAAARHQEVVGRQRAMARSGGGWMDGGWPPVLCARPRSRRPRRCRCGSQGARTRRFGAEGERYPRCPPCVARSLNRAINTAAHYEHRGGWRQADHRLHAQPPPPQGMRAGSPPYGPVAVGRARRAVPHRHRRGDGHRHRRNRRRPLRGGSRRHVGRFPSSGAPPRCKRGRVEKGGSWRWAVRHWAPPPGAAAAATQRRL